MSKLTNLKNNDVSPRKEWGKNKIILDELLNSEQLEKVISGIVDLRVEQKVNEQVKEVMDSFLEEIKSLIPMIVKAQREEEDYNSEPKITKV